MEGASGAPAALESAVRQDELKERLDALYRQYDQRFVDPDPLQFVRAQTENEDREVVGMVASALAFGNVATIKSSIAAVLEALGPRPARSVRRLEPREAARRLACFKPRWSDGRDVACLLFLLRQMLESRGSVEAFFAAGMTPGAEDVGASLASFSARALALDHGGLYRGRRLPAPPRVRYFFPSPQDGTACKRPNLYLPRMVRKDGADLGVWTPAFPAPLALPLDPPLHPNAP